MLKGISKHKIDIFILLLAIIIASIPTLCLSKTYANDDMAFHILRADGFIEAIKHFDIPYRLNSVANFGYTSAEPIMYPHVFLFIPAFFYAIFHNYILAYNLSACVCHIIAVIVMYYSCQSIYKKKEVSLIASLMTALSCTRKSLIYNGSAYAEYFATIFIPLIASGYINIMRGNLKKWLELFIGLTCVLESHIITMFYTLILLSLISLIFIKKIITTKGVLITYIKTCVLFLFVNLWYLLPFLDYYFSGKITEPGGAYKGDWALSSMMTLVDQFSVVLSRFKLMFVLTPITNNHRQLTYMSISAIIFVIVYGIYNIFTKRNKENSSLEPSEKENMFICKIFITIFFINILIYLGIFTRCFFAYFLTIQKLFSMQQMEAREVVRGLPLFFMAFAYLYVKVIKRKIFRIIPIFIIAIIPLIMFYQFTFTHLTDNIDYEKFANGDYMLKGTYNGQASVISINKYKNIFPTDIFDSKVHKSDDSIEIIDDKKGYLSYYVEYKKTAENAAGSNGNIIIPLFAYDGFVATNEKGKKLKIKKGEHALITITANNSGGRINIRFKEKPLWIMADIISLFSLVLILSFCIYKKNIYRN